MIHLDTHVVAWLYAGRVDLLSAEARRLCEARELAISPIVRVELQHLFEIGRVREPARVVVDDLSRRIDLRIAASAFDAVAIAAESQAWTRDPFDRLVVGHASVDEAPLLTKDRLIREHYGAAVWD